MSTATIYQPTHFAAFLITIARSRLHWEWREKPLHQFYWFCIPPPSGKTQTKHPFTMAPPNASSISSAVTCTHTTATDPPMNNEKEIVASKDVAPADCETASSVAGNKTSTPTPPNSPSAKQKFKQHDNGIGTRTASTDNVNSSINAGGGADNNHQLATSLSDPGYLNYILFSLGIKRQEFDQKSCNAEVFYKSFETIKGDIDEFVRHIKAILPSESRFIVLSLQSNWVNLCDLLERCVVVTKGEANLIARDITKLEVIRNAIILTITQAQQRAANSASDARVVGGEAPLGGQPIKKPKTFASANVSEASPSGEESDGRVVADIHGHVMAV